VRDVERGRESRRRWKENNPEKIAASRQREKAKPYKPRDKKKAAISAKRDYEKHKEARRARMREYYEANRQKLIERSAKWHQDNREQSRETFRLCRARRRAREMGSPDQHTKADLADILRLQAHRCAYCRANLREVRKQVDHIVPLSRGGSNGRANLQYLCEPCNQKKNAQDPIDYARLCGLLI
jgi:5-methylcytosine-specific restriction endonuclease McrA